MLFIGRKGPVGQVSQWLKDEDSRQGARLQIGSIHGPGGIGKSFLLEYSMRQMSDFDDLGYLIIRLDGQKELQSLEGLLLEELPERTELTNTHKNPFASLTRLRKQWHWMLQRTEEAIKKEYRGLPALAERMHLLLSYGLFPQRALAMRSYDLKLANVPVGELEEAVEAIQKLPAFKHENLWFKKLRGSQSPKAIRNALRRDRDTVLCDALIDDLEELFRQAQKQNHKLPPWQQRRNTRQLLLILDDYESMDPLMGGFLVEQLVPRLQRSSFRTLLLVLGRDSLLATHTSWGQHHRNLIGERLIELKPFEQQEAFELMRRRGIHNSDVWQRIWEDTQGYPFLLDLECEDELTGGASALGLKLFFDRLTRWMTPIQRAWIVPLSFLHEINLETVRAMLPKYDTQAILDWFKMEPSVRDPHANRWQVIGFVRRRVQQYIRNDSPERYEKLSLRAKEIERELQLENNTPSP